MIKKLIFFLFLFLIIFPINANYEKENSLHDKIRKFDDLSFPGVKSPLSLDNSLLDKIDLACRKC